MRTAWLPAAGILACLPGAARAQDRIGEIRIVAIGGWAAAVHPAVPGDPIGPPAGRLVGGGGLSLTFIAGGLSGGPEAMVLRGSDRRVHELGVVGRIGFGRRSVRPFLAAGVGEYFWDRRFVPPPPPDFTGPNPEPVWESDRHHVTGNIGGGVLIGTPLARLSLTAEVRLHASLFEDDTAGPRRLVTTSVGGRIAW